MERSPLPIRATPLPSGCWGCDPAFLRWTPQSFALASDIALLRPRMPLRGHSTWIAAAGNSLGRKQR
eukprot:8412176-Alexandrium_andersonii.AAC.1